MGGGNGYEFAGSSYGEKGCYSYKSKYYGIAWYGLGGDKKKISKPYDENSEYFRPEGYDCVVKSPTPKVCHSSYSSKGDVCLTLPCGVNANCQATNDGYSCSCPKGMTGDPKVKCEVYSSEFQCIITTPEECYKQSKIQGYEPGNDVNNVEFASSKYSTKACYGKIETPKSYFGLGGSLKQYAADASESGSWSSSKLIYKPCLKADWVQIGKDKKCKPERSGWVEAPASASSVEKCAQFCKSVSNNFYFKKPKCYCQIGTRETGRCELIYYKGYDVYEFRYPGYILAQNGYLCSDIGKIAANDLESCKKAKDILQKINPSISSTVSQKVLTDKPKGCIVEQNALYFNTASNDLPAQGFRQVCEGPRCNGYPKTEWDCCNPTTKCGEGEGDCDTDDDCVGDLICGSSRDKSNNCKNEFANSASFWMDKADCCTQPECRANSDCASKDQICQLGRCIRCAGGSSCCTEGKRCYEGEGDCDSDDECMPKLRCGFTNLKNHCKIRSGHQWESSTDCCYKPTSCPTVTVESIGGDGEYFYFKSQYKAMKEIVGYDSKMEGKSVKVIRHGPSGYWVGEVTIWYWNDGSYYYGGKKENRKNEDWKSGDTIMSKRCVDAVGNPDGNTCKDGEQNGEETGVDCGGPCKRCVTSRSIPWLLWATPSK